MTILQRAGAVSANLETAGRAREFVALARCIAMGRGQHSNALALAEEHRLGPRIQGILSSHHKVYSLPPDVAARQKAAALAGGTATGDWSEPLAAYNTLAAAFVESLRNFGCFDAMLPSMRRVPFRTRIGASTIGISGATVGQQQSKPIGKLTLSGTQIDELKAVAILIVADELAKFGDVVAGNLFATELSNAVATETDETFIAALITGATSFAATGVTAEHVRADLRGMLANVTTGARSQLFLLMTSSIAKALSTLHTNTGDSAFPGMRYNGGEIAGITALVSDGVPASTMALVDAQQVAVASESVQLSATNEASLQASDSPDSPPSAATGYVSLWQLNMTGLRAERFFGVQKLTSTGVCVLTSFLPQGDSPGP